MKNNRSTYSLLLNAEAEEKGRSIFETAVCGIVVLCTVFTMWQFASGSVVLPTGGSTASSQAAELAAAPVKAQPVRG